ncbi:MAG: hypothetical protein CL878_05620 [Dehalococcoidia bacterium]|nr:hypothetical protein [Dehalococcoidia bacterium]
MTRRAAASVLASPELLATWLAWAVLTTAGGTVAGVAPWFVGGLVLGLCQWFVLRWWVPSAHRWILATVVGVAVGEIVGVVASEVVSFAVGATALAVRQWLTLRRWLPSAWWWLPATAIGWTAGLVLAGTPVVGGVTAVPVAAVGLVTGLALVLLLARNER